MANFHTHPYFPQRGSHHFTCHFYTIWNMQTRNLGSNNTFPDTWSLPLKKCISLPQKYAYRTAGTISIKISPSVSGKSVICFQDMSALPCSMAGIHRWLSKEKKIYHRPRKSSTHFSQRLHNNSYFNLCVLKSVSLSFNCNSDNIMTHIFYKALWPLMKVKVEKYSVFNKPFTMPSWLALTHARAHTHHRDNAEQRLFYYPKD